MLDKRTKIEQIVKERGGNKPWDDAIFLLNSRWWDGGTEGEELKFFFLSYFRSLFILISASVPVLFCNTSSYQSVLHCKLG